MATEQEVVGDQQYQSDDNILCDDCDKMYKGDCPAHGALEWVKTTRAVDSTHYTPCIASLPDGLLLKESGIPGNEMGVFAARLIYKRTMFGPYEGKKISQTDQHNRKDLTFCWDLLKEGIPSHILDGSDEKHSNWMHFVTYARDKREQNLIAFQFQGQIFYRTFRDVYPGEELMIWYEDEYTCNLDELQAEYSKDQMPEFACQRCRLVFAGSTYLYKHHKFRCSGGPLLSTYGARTTGLVGALFRLPVAIANDSWSNPVTNNNEGKPHSETENHHGRRKGKPRKLPRPSEIEEIWNPEQSFGPAPIADLNDKEADVGETTTAILPPKAETLDSSSEDVVELENNNTNYLKRLTSDEISAPQLEKKPKLDNGVIVEVEKNDDKYPYHCGACGKSFARPTWWAKHESGCYKAKNKAASSPEKRKQDTVGSTPEETQISPKKLRKEPYSCQYCGKSFACPSWRERHETVHTKYLDTSNEESSEKPNNAAVNGTLPYVCRDCGKRYSFPSRLAHHRAAKHPLGKAAKTLEATRKHICRDCGRGFAVAAWLTRHRMKVHTHSFSKKHMCGVCGRSFAVSFWLTRHMKIHEQDRKSKTVDTSQAKVNTTSVQPQKSGVVLPWVCGECGLRFRFISWLKRHQKNNKHDNGYYDEPEKADSEYQFICDQGGCERKFKTKHHLARHKQSHLSKQNTSEVDTQESVQSVFVCEFKNCGKTFQTKRMFTRHVVKHPQNTEALPSLNSKCNVCGKVFGTKDLLERHFKRIHGNKSSTDQNESTGRGPPYVCKHCNKEFAFPLQFGRHLANHKKEDKIPKSLKPPEGTDETKTYHCDVCNISFKSLHIWNKHRDGKHRKKSTKPDPEHPYKCDICGRTFAVTFWLTRHKNEHIKEEFPYRCDVCGKNFAAQAWLTRHKNQHLKEEHPYNCEQCEKSFASLAWLTRHKNEHEKQNELSASSSITEVPDVQKKLPFECDQCEKSFASMAWLTRHKNEHEKQNAPSASSITEVANIKDEHPFKCEQCEKSFASLAWLTRHKNEHEKQNAPSASSSITAVPDVKEKLPYKCEQCEKSFASMAWLTRHKNEHEKQNEPSASSSITEVPNIKPESTTNEKSSAALQCDQCGKTFVVQAWLTRHKRAHDMSSSPAPISDLPAFKPMPITKGNSKVYQCDLCPKEFPWPSWLMKHRKLHMTKLTKVKAKKVKAKTVVKKSATNTTDAESYEGMCANDLFEMLDKNGVKQYQCKVCKKSTVWHTGIMYHIRVHHTHEKPFVCKVCSKAFHMSGDLTKHMRRHSGEKPYNCQLCKKRFSTSQQVKKHQVVHQSQLKSKSSLFHCKQCGKGYRDRSSVWRHLARKACKKQNTQGNVESNNETTNTIATKPKKILDASKQTSHPQKPVKQVKLNKPDKPARMKVPEKKSTKKVTKKKSFLCKNCNKSFPTSDLFKAHIESYKKAQHIVCEYCGKCWVRTADLKRHLRVHTNERPYLCPDCGLAFKVSDALTRHMHKLHPKSTKKIIKVKCQPIPSEESNQPTTDTETDPIPGHMHKLYPKSTKKIIKVKCQPIPSEESNQPTTDTETDPIPGHMHKLLPKSTKKITKVKCQPIPSEESNQPTTDIETDPILGLAQAKTVDAEGGLVPTDVPSTSESQDDCVTEAGESSMEIPEQPVSGSELDAPDTKTDEVSGGIVKNTPQEVQNSIDAEVVDEEDMENPKVVGKEIKKKNSQSNRKCHFCGKVFSGPGNLARHIRLHTGEKPFKCRDCGECFMRTDILTEHARKHHPR